MTDTPDWPKWAGKVPDFADELTEPSYRKLIDLLSKAKAAGLREAADICNMSTEHYSTWSYAIRAAADKLES